MAKVEFRTPGKGMVLRVAQTRDVDLSDLLEGQNGLCLRVTILGEQVVLSSRTNVHLGDNHDRTVRSGFLLGDKTLAVHESIQCHVCGKPFNVSIRPD